MSRSQDSDPDLEHLETIYDALDAGEPDRALSLCRAAQAELPEPDPVLQFLCGIALLELDRPADSATELRRAVEIDPEDGEFRANLADALFRSGQFAEAQQEAQLAIECDANLPNAHYALALTLEREGRLDDADRSFASATRLDAEAYPAPQRWSVSEFERHVAAAADRLPEAFRKHLDQVVATVEQLPSDDIVFAEEPALDPELLGLFVGHPLPDRTTLSPGAELPARILLFQRNLERCFPDAEDLALEIVRTLYHELGHYLGLEEDELEAIDLG
ncbi:MAG: tetratricopeptide repeat protein [bacterium]|nr:tetratricopeptide repeat protein [bacterium]